MECNKEEATRAKELAENKMHGRDFVGAKKLLLKALQLLPDIENASHMLTVCEVHCSAGSLVNGQTDYYGVLQVEVSADESLIRKQYRKLALLLHPDKNKFTGAESAFKLVGEAYKVLSDQANRQVYDSKRRVQIRTLSSWQSAQNSRNARRYPAATINVSNSQFSGLKPQEQQQPFVSSQYFWTMCVFCNNRFQYARSWLGMEVQCLKCFRKFFAFEVSSQNIPPPGSSSGFSWSRAGLHETSVPVHPSYNHASQTVPATKHEYKPGNQERRSCVDGMAGNQKSENAKKETKASAKPSYGTAGRARNRKVVVDTSDSSSSSGSDSIDSLSEVEPTVLNDGPTSSRYPRRLTRSKINVTYKEDESEDDGSSYHPKKLRKVGSFSRKNRDASSPVVTNGVKLETGKTSNSEDGINGEQTENHPFKDNLLRPSVKERVSKKDEKQVRARSNTTSAVSSKSQKPKAVVSSFTYPDTQFFDFNQERNKSRFSEDQVWAVYDDDDGMPRYYALIQKPFGSTLRYIWLENNPTSAAEKAWVAAQLPIACGNFTQGKICSTVNDEIFSHLVFPNNIRKEIYSFYPKKGEIWALFKDWDIGWSSAVEKPRNYEYEIVQVVSDFAYGQDITVCHLVKVEGFRYVFALIHEGNTVIPSGQLLKFSHCIPFHSLHEEIEGIPRDSFELDPAALPETFLKISDAINADTVEGSDSKFANPVNAKDRQAGGAVNKKRSRHSTNDNSDDIFSNSDEAREVQPVDSEVPCYTNRRTGETTGHDEDDADSSSNGEASTKSEFFNFHELRSEEKFEKGQIWALYSEIDEHPNYYAWIKKGEWEEFGFISIKWLEHLSVTQEDKLWSKNGRTFGCGRFKIVAGVDRFNTTDTFSHMVHAKAIRKNDLYEIYPNKGEIWALYKNWSLLLTSSDVRNAADYFVVQIVDQNESLIKAVSLIKVKGYCNVFKPETGGVADLEIPIKECFRFSHLIPSFQLTDEESGKLKGCWELDPDSVPNVILAMDS